MTIFSLPMGTIDLTVDVQFNPSAWIGVGNFFSDTLPNKVYNKKWQILKVPDSFRIWLPTPTAPVSEFLNYPLPIWSSALSFCPTGQWFSSDEPPTPPEILLAHLIPPERVLKELNKVFGQNWFDGTASIMDPQFNNGSERFPLWVFIMKTVALAKCKSWSKCKEWQKSPQKAVKLDQNAKLNKVKKQTAYLGIGLWHWTLSIGAEVCVWGNFWVQSYVHQVLLLPLSCTASCPQPLHPSTLNTLTFIVSSLVCGVIPLKSSSQLPRGYRKVDDCKCKHWNCWWYLAQNQAFVLHLTVHQQNPFLFKDLWRHRKCQKCQKLHTVFKDYQRLDLT